MNVSEFLVRFAPTLFTGSTLILGVGICAMALSRSLVQRKRFATTTLLVFLGWVALAILPMRRPFTEMVPDAKAAASTPRVAPVPIPRTVPTPSRSSQGSADQLPVPSQPVSVDPMVSTESVPAQTDDVARIAEVVASILAMGSLLFGSYLVLAWLVLRHRVARARVAPPRVLRIAREFGFDVEGLRILVADEPTRPYCFGLRNPTIVLPADLFRPECRERLCAVLVHELCHITDQDLRDQVLLAICLPVLYWHPLFWVLRDRLRLSAEMVADDRATQMVDRKIYVRELIELVDQPAKSLPLAPALPVLGLESEFYRRMNMLLNRKRPLTTRCSTAHTVFRRCGAALVLTAMTLSWGTNALPAQGGDEPETASTGQQISKEGVGTYRFELIGTYPSPSHLEKMLLCVAKLGFTTTGLRVNATGLDSSSPRRFFVTLSCHVANQEQVRRLTSKVRKMRGDLHVMGITINRFVPRRPHVDGATKRAVTMKRISLSETSVDIRKIVASIAKSVGANIVVAPEVQGKVTLRLRNIPWRDALEAACKTLGNAVIQEDHGILRVVPRSSLHENENPPRVYFAFDNTPIQQVIDTIAKLSGANIVVSPKVQGKVTLRLHNIPWRDALEATCKTLGYVVIQGDRGILRVVPRSSHREKQETPRVYFAFNNAPIEQVIDTIAKLSGANIVVSPKVQGKVTLRLRNIPWRDALEAACKTLGYAVIQGDRGILRVVPRISLR